MPSRNHKARKSEAGFTLVEALASLAIIAVCLSAIGALGAASMRSGLAMERHVDSIQETRKLFAALPGRSELADGPTTGATDGYRWEVDAAPYSPPFVPANGSNIWTALTIALSVRAPDGSQVEIDTIRLRKRATK